MQQHVLIIENGEGNLELIAKLVRRAGLTPVGATSLTEGKARFSQNMPKPFCVLLLHTRFPMHQKAKPSTLRLSLSFPPLLQQKV